MTEDDVDPSEQNGGDEAESNLPAKAPLDPETIKKHRWILSTYLNPALGKWPMAQITAQQLLPALKAIEKDGKVETAHRARSLAGRIFCYAHSTGRAAKRSGKKLAVPRVPRSKAESSERNRVSTSGPVIDVIDAGSR